MITQTLRRTATGRFWILVFRDGRFLRSIGVIKRRLSVGSGTLCDVSLDDPALPTLAGTIADKGIDVIFESSTGRRLAFPFYEPITVGAFVLVRVPAGVDITRVALDLEARLRGEPPAVGPIPFDARAEIPLVDAEPPAPYLPIDAPEGSLEAGEYTDTSEVDLHPGGGQPVRDMSNGGPLDYLDLRALDLEPQPVSMPIPPWTSRDIPRDQPPEQPVVVTCSPADENPALRQTSSDTGRFAPVKEGPAKAMAFAPPAPMAPCQVAPPPGGPPRTRAAAETSPGAAPRLAPMPVPQAKPFIQASSKTGGLNPVASAAGGVMAGLGALASLAIASDASFADGESGGAIARRTTVRHYTQMNPGRTYPLLVIISAGRVERVVMEEVAQVESDTGFVVTRESPMVRIEPVIPGCAVAPTTIAIDCTVDLAEARFHVTPIVEGDVPEARIEIRHEGKLVDQVPIPTRIATQTVAKASATFSAATPFAMQVLRLAGSGEADRSDASGYFLGAVHDAAAAVGGPTNLGLLIAVGGALIALFAYLRNRAKEGSPIVRFLDYSAQVGSAEDQAVEKLKARLAIFIDGSPLVIPILKRRLTIGADAGCDVVVRHRAIAARHAEVRIEGGRMSIASIDGAPLSLRGAGATGSIDLAGKDEAALALGTVPCWYCREVATPGLDSGPSRAAIVEHLSMRLVSFEADVRRAFAERDRPVRACAAALMSAGKLDLETWLRAREVGLASAG